MKQSHFSLMAVMLIAAALALSPPVSAQTPNPDHHIAFIGAGSYTDGGGSFRIGGLTPLGGGFYGAVHAQFGEQAEVVGQVGWAPFISKFTPMFLFGPGVDKEDIEALPSPMYYFTAAVGFAASYAVSDRTELFAAYTRMQELQESLYESTDQISAGLLVWTDL